MFKIEKTRNKIKLTKDSTKLCGFVDYASGVGAWVRRYVGGMSQKVVLVEWVAWVYNKFLA